MPVAQDSRLASRVAVASQGLAALFALWACAAALRDQLTVPFADDWRILDRYQSLPLLAYLFGSENGHRLPATLALFAIDFEWFGGRMRTLVIASIALALASVGVLAWTFRRQGVLGRALPRSALALAGFALFWALSCNDLLRGIYHMSVQTLALALVATAALSQVDPGRIAASRGWLALAALAASLATWSHGVGAAAWAALVAVAVVRRFPVRVVAGLLAAGAAMAALYAATLPADPQGVLSGSLAQMARDPGAFAGMVVGFLGTAPARVASGLGLGEPYPPQLQPELWAAHGRDLYRMSVAFGALGLLGFAVLAVRRWRGPRPAAALDSVGVGLMAFALAAALLVGATRLTLGGPIGVLHPRFLIWSTLFWVGVLCALVPRVPGAPAGRLSSLAVLAMPVLALAMLPALRGPRDYHEATRSHASKLSLALLLGLRHDELARSVSLEDAEAVYRVAARLEAEGRWPFEGARHGLRGSRLADRFVAAPPCLGRLERRQVQGSLGAAAVAGWLVPPPAGPAPDLVVLVDAGGVVRGLADFASVPPHRRAGMRAGARAWTGFVADYDPAQTYAAHAILGDARSACELRAP